MRTEKEVQAYLADLKKLAAVPCDCQNQHPEGRAKYHAEFGIALIHAGVAIGTLQWVLGDCSYDQVIEIAAKRAREV